MIDKKMFSSEVELGKFLGSVGVIRDAYQAISQTSSTYELHTTRSDIKVLAFNGLSDFTSRFSNGEFDLVSSEDHGDLKFISTIVNPKFSINKAAVELFKLHFAELSKLSNQLLDSPLIITGQGMGGYLAIMFALLHLNEVDEAEYNGSESAKRPICITFGSPLLGNENLQGAISERPLWKSSFLNVVAKTDLLASCFTLDAEYKPFGTFLFCTESGGHVAFEDQEAILAVLGVMGTSNAGNSQLHDCNKELSSMRKKVLYRGPSGFTGFNLSPLRAGIVSQFQEISVLDDISNEFIEKVEKKQVKMIKTKQNRYEPTRKLNDIKIKLTYMEWYMKTRRKKGGYYDVYKKANAGDKDDDREGIRLHQLHLHQYWKKMVEESDRMPQKQGAQLRKRWLYSGVNYRRILEPLDIADYYKSGKTNYIASRPEHYRLLEKWSEKETKDRKTSDKRKKSAASLTEDSCFWAHVEDALLLLNGGKIGTHDIKWYEEYFWVEIENFSVSPEIFLEGSSFMMWWDKYKAYNGNSCNPDFSLYMNNKNTGYGLYK